MRAALTNATIHRTNTIACHMAKAVTVETKSMVTIGRFLSMVIAATASWTLAVMVQTDLEPHKTQIRRDSMVETNTIVVKVVGYAIVNIKSPASIPQNVTIRCKTVNNSRVG